MHPPPSIFLLIFSLIISLFISIQTHAKEDSPPFVDCSANSFTSPSPYQSNLRRLLSSLAVTTPRSPYYFSTDYVGSSPSSQVFGLAQCRPDASPALCSSCINYSAAAITSQDMTLGCGSSKTAALRLDNCLIRYSDSSSFNTGSDHNFFRSYSVENTGSDLFRQVQGLMAHEVIPAAVKAASRFAVGVLKGSEVKNDIYGMAWCTMGVPLSRCQQCFDGARATIPPRKARCRIASVICEIRIDNNKILSVPPPVGRKGKSRNISKIALFLGISAVVATLLFLFTILLRRRSRKLAPLAMDIGIEEKEIIINAETLMFDFGNLKNSTDNFSPENKLGQGGFGQVYKGVLGSGQEIAVKRLSKTSVQGLAELKNEVKFVAKLQHKNLVKLLGYCLEGVEKLLIYEYLPNGSLDKFLFDPEKRLQLDWKTRSKIIEEIGRGLLYLHEDSHLKIVHRDLKASNILLDGSMNPKISDFGLAKLFGVDETQRKTERIAGTYGYMAPEYALHGRFSTKSDVFSYGVLILEIITGRKNSSFQVTDLALDLPSFIWRYWNEGKALSVVDQSLGGEYRPQEALRSIHIGLLCVQEDQAKRPSMASLVVMYSSHSIALPAPAKPAFYDGSGFPAESLKNGHGLRRSQRQSRENNVNVGMASVNGITISEMEAR